MPTWDATERFRRDFDKLTAAEQKAFWAAVKIFMNGLRTGEFPAALRIHKLRHTPLWSLTWGSDGRATFRYGPPQIEGHPHIIWRRVGTHEIHR